MFHILFSACYCHKHDKRERHRGPEIPKSTVSIAISATFPLVVIPSYVKTNAKEQLIELL